MTMISGPKPERHAALGADVDEERALYAAAKDRELHENRLAHDLAEYLARLDQLYLRDSGPKALDDLPPQLAGLYRDAAVFALRYTHKPWRELAHEKTRAYFDAQLAEYDFTITRRGAPMTDHDERLGLDLIIRRVAHYWIWTLMGHVGLSVPDLVRLEQQLTQQGGPQP